jgi:hypothetical protein
MKHEVEALEVEEIGTILTTSPLQEDYKNFFL